MKYALIPVLMLLAGCAHKGCPPGQEEYPFDVCMDFSTVTAQDRQHADNNLKRLEYENELKKNYKWLEGIE